MVSVYTTGKTQLEKPAAGDYPNTWSSPLNTNFDNIDGAMSGRAQITMTSANYTLSTTEAKNFRIDVIGALSANVTLSLPLAGPYSIGNSTTGSFTLSVASSSPGSTTIVCRQGASTLVYCNGSNVFYCDSGPWLPYSGGSVSGMTLVNLSITGTGSSLDSQGSAHFAGNCRVDADLHVTGTAYATTFVTTSDARLKDEVQTIHDALALVEKMRGVRYRRIDLGNRNVGVIAQEMAEVIPEVVHSDKTGYLAVSYSNLVGVLIEAIKELSERVRKLEASNG